MSVLDYQGQRSQSNVTGIAGGDPNTGEMRRKYNFAEKFTELSIDQTPFFRIVSKIGNKPTDDPQFKFTEKRQSWMKRYGYLLGVASNAAASGADDADGVDSMKSGGTKSVIAAETHLYMATDYQNQGNKSNIIGQTGKTIGAYGTRPQFYLPNQVIKVNVGNTFDGKMDDYRLYQIEEVYEGWVCHTADNAYESAVQLGAAGDWTLKDVADEVGKINGVAVTNQGNFYEAVQLKCTLIRDDGLAGDSHMTTYTSDSTDGFADAAAPTSDLSVSIAGTLEPRRSYVTGTSYKEGSTLMQKNWSDQPYSTGFGYTQIFRNEFGMTNTARATALRYEKNEWARLWRDKLIEHKWEIEQTALFGKQDVKTVGGDTHYYTQGVVDYVLNQGNLFLLDHATKTEDDFLEDLSGLVDPRYNNSKDMMFFCDTATYNWLHKLGGYFNNNLEMSSNHRADFAVSGKKKSFGVNFTTISTVYGDINVARNIHLDGSGVKILGVNMSYVKWRPLVGNGVNRDTSIYVGVQTLENTGTDKRVDMILTEGGFEFSMPECHALWK